MAKYFRRGKSKILFVPAVAAPATGPTASELAAGLDLSLRIAEIGGFQATNSPIPTPNLAESFTSQIDGEDAISDSSLTLYDDDTDTAVRTALEKGTLGYVILAPYGIATGKRVEVWAAKTSGYNDEWTVGNDPARSVCTFVVTAAPVQDAAVGA